MSRRRTVVVYVEDPGAANVLADLQTGLQGSGLRCRLYSGGAGDAQLRAIGVGRAQPLPEPTESVLQDDVCAVVVGIAENPATPGLRLVRAARRRHIATVAMVDNGTNADAVFRGDGEKPMACAPDRVLVPDEWTAQRFVAAGLPRARIVVVGNPLHDRLQTAAARLSAEDRDAGRRRLFPDAGDRPVVVFLEELSSTVGNASLRHGPDYTLHGPRGTGLRTAVVFEEVVDALAAVGVEAHFVVRLHPKSDGSELGTLMRAADQVSRTESAHEIVWFADLVVGMTTSLLGEAARLGVPVLAVVPRPAEREWLSEIRDGLVPVVGTREELRAALAAMPSERKPPAAADAGAVGRMVAAVREAAGLT